MSAGQGLLETTIAIGIIVTGLFAAFTLTLANGRASEAAGLRFGAVALAREGMEVVRMLRDSNGLAGRPWDGGPAFPEWNIGGAGADRTAIAMFDPERSAWSLAYAVDDLRADAARLSRLTTGAGTFLIQRPDAAAGEPTPYRRLLTLDPICMAKDGRTTIAADQASCADPPVGVRVRTAVAWTHRGGTHEVTVEELLYDWR